MSQSFGALGVSAEVEQALAARGIAEPFRIQSLVVPVALSAQAFGLNEIGSCAVARGFATTASPCRDASTIFWNPMKLTAR